MGGTVTRLAMALVPNFSDSMVEYLGEPLDRYLDIDALVAAQFLRKIEGENGWYLERQWTWLVRNFSWIDLPHPVASFRPRDNPNDNIWWIERDHAQLPEEAEVVRNAHISRQRPRRRPPVPQVPEASSSGSGTFDFSAMQAQMRDLQTTLDHQGVLLSGLYSSGVDQGHINPYLNYPMWPPQQGPLPGWFSDQPTHPYHPPRPEGLDYRFPGGSDPFYDPNNPPFTTYPDYPSNYHSSVPPMEQTWGNAPMPPLTPLHDPPSNMDEDRE